MSKYYLFVLSLAVLFTSCQKVVDADKLLDTEAKVFITSYISPQDTVLRVNVSRALPSIGTPLSVSDQEANEAKFLIKDAQVTISDEAGNSSTLLYSEENKSYLANTNTLAIVGSQSYFLKVTVAGVDYNASCQIPEKITTLNERINLKDDTFGGTEAELNISFQDIAGEKNFYVLGGFGTGTYQFEEEEPQRFDFSLFFDTGKFQTDSVEDGGPLSGEALINIGNEVNELQITFQVASVEEILLQNLRSAATNVDAEGNPFAEYAIAANNFSDEGAVGVFAGYQLTEKVVKFEF